MQVYKFGGASVKDAPAVKNVATILRDNSSKEKVVVILCHGQNH
jgi:aspartokinase